ncbi:MAG: anti-sigma factor [Usitatibacter sp.]
MIDRDDPSLAEDKAVLKRHFDAVLTEPIPARMYLRQPRWIGYTRVALVFVAGAALGGSLAMLNGTPAPAGTLPGAAMAVRAARAHAIYASEVRHPVEVDASQQDHLVKWLSKRLGLELKAPVLSGEGYDLLGGRLLPGPDGPVAQFMYQEPGGKRLTLYVTRRSRAEQVTAFRFALEGSVSVFYWIDRDSGYALSGDIDKTALARLANAVYKQLEP